MRCETIDIQLSHYCIQLCTMEKRTSSYQWHIFKVLWGLKKTLHEVEMTKHNVWQINVLYYRRCQNVLRQPGTILLNHLRTMRNWKQLICSLTASCNQDWSNKRQKWSGFLIDNKLFCQTTTLSFEQNFSMIFINISYILPLDLYHIVSCYSLLFHRCHLSWDPLCFFQAKIEFFL